MKKFAIAALLASAATFASATGISAFTKYEYDNLTTVSGASLHRGVIGLSFDKGTIGTLQVGTAVQRAYVAGGRWTDQGVELGYQNGLSVGRVDLTGRVSYTRLNESKDDQVRVSVEAARPFMKNVRGVVAGEHVRSDGEAVANRLFVGADVAVNKQLSVRAGATRTNVTGVSLNANGLVVGANYRF